MRLDPVMEVWRLKGCSQWELGAEIYQSDLPSGLLSGGSSPIIFAVQIELLLLLWLDLFWPVRPSRSTSPPECSVPCGRAANDSNGGHNVWRLI